MIDPEVQASIETIKALNLETSFEDMKDSEGNWRIKGAEQKKRFSSYAVEHIKSNKELKDPRTGLNKVFIWDDDMNDYDEKLIRDYQKVSTGEKDNIVLHSKTKDLRKKADRLYNISPDTKSVVDYAARIGDSPEMVEAWLIDRGYGAKETLKTSKKLSKESQALGGDKIEGGHEISFRTDVGEGKRAATDQYTYFYEPKEQNRGLGQKGGSNKHMNLDVAAGTVPRHDIEGYEQFKSSYKEATTGEVNPYSTLKEEFHPHEQKRLREVPSDAPTEVADEVKTAIYKERDEIRKRTGIELNSKTGKRLNAKGLYRNIARVAGKSNNPLVNVSGDIVGAIMDGVAFTTNPSKDTAIDLALSGTQAVVSLAAIGLAAVPIPGGRPGAFMLMKIGDNVNKLKAFNDKVAQVERLWNFSSKINTTKGVAESRKVEIANEVISKQQTQEALTGTLNKTKAKFKNKNMLDLSSFRKGT